MAPWLARSWRKRGIVACLLWPLSLAYGVLSGFHCWLYRARVLKIERSAVPVVVVGNVVAGGAGKTPLVIALAMHLQQQGIKVGIVSRGYGRKGRQGKKGDNCLEVLENTPVLVSGDEPALIIRAQEAPVFIAKKRLDAIGGLLARHPKTQVIISDDGLQHHSMARDIEITVFDDRGVGNGWLLPAGPLRQPYAADPSQSGLVLHTGQAPAFKGFVSARQLADYALNADGHQVMLDTLKGRALTALAGIANPDAFFDMLKARGLQLQQTIALPDHFDFSGYLWPVSPDSIVLCTEKDAVKLFQSLQYKGCNVLAVPLKFSPEPAFFAAFDVLLSPLLIGTIEAAELPLLQGIQNGHQTA